MTNLPGAGQGARARSALPASVAFWLLLVIAVTAFFINLSTEAGTQNSAGEWIVTPADFESSQRASLVLLLTLPLCVAARFAQVRVRFSLEDRTLSRCGVWAALAGLPFLASFAAYLTTAGGIGSYVTHGAVGALGFEDFCNLIGTGAGLGFTVVTHRVTRQAASARAQVSTTIPRADSLTERIAFAQTALNQTAQTVREAVGEAGQAFRTAIDSTAGIVDALEDELRARRAALDELTAQVKLAETRAEQARTRAQIDESTAEAVDALLDRRMQDRLAELEAAGHAWDKKITVFSLALSLPIGVVSGYMVALFTSH